MGLYALTIFLSAFLLFQVQPLIGKCILPWFGGGPAVWTTCMLFFQAALLAGYAYAHVIRTRLAPGTQALVHSVLLIAAALLLPILPSATWKPEGGTDPAWRILIILAVSVGLPYFALSATSPLLQAWFSMTHPSASPYRLYALSNAGSLLALASYPFVVEPLLRLKTQSWAWSGAFVAFAILCAACAIRLWRTKPAADGAAGFAGRDGRAAAVPNCGESGGTVARGGRRRLRRRGGETASKPPAQVVAGLAQEVADNPRPRLTTVLMWIALPACGSVMLLAVTNQMCMDVGVVPFLWVLPLGLYLLTFILCFQSDGIYWRPVFWPMLGLTTAAIVWLLYLNVHVKLEAQTIGYSAGLFACCMVCHGELARLKPSPRHLTTFYLCSSAGGALGGLFVALVAPLVFRGYYELHVGLWACLALAALALWREKASDPAWRRTRAFRLFWFASGAVLGALGFSLFIQASGQRQDAVSVSRNFYGVLTVEACQAVNPPGVYYQLTHGRIQHGSQFESPPMSLLPTKYYWEKTGVGLAILNRRPSAPMKVGVVGLGTGTLAAYGRPGDTYRFYEINPEVQRLAQTQFTYLADSAADCEVALGDARLSLEREPPQGFDILALDAFSSDAIPVHLLTQEAMDIYQRHLKPDGVLAIHISSRFMDLKPVVAALAARSGMALAAIRSDKGNKPDAYSSALWVLLTRDRKFLEIPAIRSATSVPDPDAPPPRLWTDDYSDLVSILKW